ncbi:MAG TPA: thioredoxin domain-containing protein [Pyrinomonadaceae bacterium]|nr:thioredoxin domain-containing protein [Pyrinomonadaceae bacterium]
MRLNKNKLLIVVAILIGVSPVLSSGQDVTPGASPARIVGNPGARVTIEVFIDYQCPPCERFNEQLKKIEAKHKNDVKIILRNLPLSPMHLNAVAAARTAEAAGQQGKFREMVNLLFSERSSWADSKEARTMFTSFARRLDLNMNRFLADMDSELVGERIRLDIERAQSLGVEGTPTVFLNGKKLSIEDLFNFDSLSDQIRKETNR